MIEASKRPDSRVLKAQRLDNCLILTTDGGKIKIEPKTQSIVRVVFTGREEFSREEKPGVIYNEVFSGWEHEEFDSDIVFKTPELKLRINKKGGSISYYSRNGKLLLKEREGDCRSLEEFDSFIMSKNGGANIEKINTPDGEKILVKNAAMDFNRSLYRTRLHLCWQQGEALYGLGQHEEGAVNLRGKTVYLHQANMKIAVPVLVSTLGYGILMDTYSPAVFCDNEFGSYIYTEADAEMDYYFMYGGDIDGVIGAYRRLTGKAGMLPKWAYGFIQSQERYESAEELISIVDAYRQRKIGLDCIVLDWCSWEDGLWGQKSMDKKRFPDPALMMKEIHSRNARLMVSIWPNMDEKSDNYKEFSRAELLLPNSTIYNVFSEAGRRLYWKQANEGFFRYGIDAWWCDSSEPFTPEWNRAEKPEPGAAYLDFYTSAAKHMPAQLCNSYGLAHAQGIYEGQREESGDKRVVNLTRSGYTGQQRYNAIMWSGDISASWDTMKKQIAAGLNFSATGIPYWTLDIGAFFVKRGGQWFWNGEYEDTSEDLGYRELFVRWYQLGCFLPIFRSHGTDCRRELWKFGSEGEAFYDALLKANRLRYSLIDYIYSTAAAVWRKDKSIMRLLAFDFPEDEKVHDIGDQYLFGESLMVCPVTQPMYYEQGSREIHGAEKSRRVYLPKGCGWYDFYTNEYYEGGCEIEAHAPLDTIPVFVKEGVILPFGPPLQYANEANGEKKEIRVYSGRDGSFELYSDSGDGWGYEKGEYDIIRFKWHDDDRNLSISKNEDGFSVVVI